MQNLWLNQVEVEGNFLFGMLFLFVLDMLR